MSEKSEIDKILTDSAKLVAKTTDSELSIIDKAILDFAPEIAYIYQIREDESEAQQIKTGRLHENRILGIILKFYLEGKRKITTGEVEEDYKRYFKEIARSTISTYLNMLKKEFTLYKKRDGRIIYYIFYEDPPVGIKPFWFTRVFCIVPAYFGRASIFSNLYFNIEDHVNLYINEFGSGDKEILIRNSKFIIGLILLNIFLIRSSKCVLCQFSKREIYNRLEELIGIAIKDRSDVLPEELSKELLEKYAEIPMFHGIDIGSNESKNNIAKEIVKFADMYKKDLEFQIMVSLRRKDLRLQQKLALEEENSE